MYSKSHYVNIAHDSQPDLFWNKHQCSWYHENICSAWLNFPKVELSLLNVKHWDVCRSQAQCQFKSTCTGAQFTLRHALQQVRQT